MRNLLLIPAALLALLALPALAYTHNPSESHATAIVLPTPTATMDAPISPVTEALSLPTCAEEDGAGMALCYWDAQKQGNGMGTSVVSGDCAPDIMGAEASALCVNLHSRASVTVQNADGSSNTIPNGADLVGECLYDWDGEDSTKAELSDCIKAQMNS